MNAELKGIFSPDYNDPHTPDDPECCSVLMHADIGIKNSEASDTFTFNVVTPSWLLKNPTTRWGSNYLLMPEFSWQQTENMVSKLVTSTSGKSWEEIAFKLSKFMEWEFDNYQPYEG